MLSRRLTSQITQFMDLIQQPLSLQTYHEDDIKLTKDYFGLHKLITLIHKMRTFFPSMNKFPIF